MQQTFLVNDVSTILNFFRAETSMYHAIGYSTLLFLEAVMTFETVSTVVVHANATHDRNSSIQFFFLNDLIYFYKVCDLHGLMLCNCSKRNSW